MYYACLNFLLVVCPAGWKPGEQTVRIISSKYLLIYFITNTDCS